MKFNKKDVEELHDLVGGSENILKLTHCISRMRFSLKDINLAKTDIIKSKSWAQGVITNSGEYQVIIGTKISEFYDLYCKTNSINNEVKIGEINTDFVELKKPKMSFVQFVSEIFAPILMLLVAYGMFELLRTPFFLSSNATKNKTLIEINSYMELISKGLTFFIVIGVCWSTFKVMGGKGIYGMAIGAILVQPSLTALGDIKITGDQTLLGQMPGWNIFGDIKFPWKISFEGLIIPIVIVGILGVYIEKGMNKVKLGGARMMIQPIVVIAATVFITMITIAPLGLLLTNYLSISFKFLMTNGITKYIFTPIIAMFYSPMVIFGLHRTITPLIIQDISLYQGSLLLGLLIISNVSLSVGCLAFGFKYRKCKKIKEVAYSNGISGFIAGVTEPALYSISFKYIYPLVGSMIGTAFGSLLYTAASVWTGAAPFGILGLIGFLAPVPDNMNLSPWYGGSFVWGFFSVILAIGISILSNWLLSNVKYFKERTLFMLKNEYEYDAIHLNKEQKLIIKQNRKIEKNNERMKKHEKISK